jgi:eukaryotic-like serine/threonine-protein kinase
MPAVARDGKNIYAVGTEQRGELIRYDAKSKQFLALLPGVAAFSPTFSRDGRWMAYTVFPDHALWRSRTDGTDALQLTFPPAQVFYPAISPDGTRVVYSNSAGATSVISMEGGTPQTLVQADSHSARWSPDGNRLVFIDSSNPGHRNVQLLDLSTGRRSVVAGLEGIYAVRWVADDLLVAITGDSKKLMIYDFKTERWSDLVTATLPGYLVNVEHSPDYKYAYYTTGGPDPMVCRVRLSDRRIETISSLKKLPLAVGPGLNTQFGVAADGSPVFARDTGSQEIYALSVKWP